MKFDFPDDQVINRPTEKYFKKREREKASAFQNTGMGKNEFQEQEDGWDSKVSVESANSKTESPLPHWPQAQGHLQNWLLEFIGKYFKNRNLGTYVHYNCVS